MGREFTDRGREGEIDGGNFSRKLYYLMCLWYDRDEENENIQQNHDSTRQPNDPSVFMWDRSQSIRHMLAHSPASEIEELRGSFCPSPRTMYSTLLHAPEEVSYQKMLVKKCLGQAHCCHMLKIYVVWIASVWIPCLPLGYTRHVTRASIVLG